MTHPGPIGTGGLEHLIAVYRPLWVIATVAIWGLILARYLDDRFPTFRDRFTR